MMRVPHTVWLSLLIATAAAVVVLPSTKERPFSLTEPLRERLGQAEFRFNLQSEFYRREHSRVLARAATAHPITDTGAVVFIRPPDVPIGFEQRMRKFAAKGIARLPRRDGHMRVVYVLTLDTGDVIAGTTVQKMRGHWWSTDVFPPTSVARDICVIVARAHDPRALKPAEELRDGSTGEPWWAEPLGQCWWYAAYGTPGRGVAAWLDSTQYAPIQMRASYYYNWGLYQYAGWIGGYDYDWIGRDRSRLAMTACASGRASSCDALILTNISDDYVSDQQAATAGWIGVGRSWNIAPNRNAAALLRRMQSALGPEEFERLWKSDDALPDAFKKINGGSLASWIRDETNAVVPPNRDHPLPSLASLISLVAGTVALIFLGTRAVARRSGFA